MYRFWISAAGEEEKQRLSGLGIVFPVLFSCLIFAPVYIFAEPCARIMGIQGFGNYIRILLLTEQLAVSALESFRPRCGLRQRGKNLRPFGRSGQNFGVPRPWNIFGGGSVGWGIPGEFWWGRMVNFPCFHPVGPLVQLAPRNILAAGNQGPNLGSLNLVRDPAASFPCPLIPSAWQWPGGGTKYSEPGNFSWQFPLAWGNPGKPGGAPGTRPFGVIKFREPLGSNCGLGAFGAPFLGNPGSPKRLIRVAQGPDALGPRVWGQGLFKNLGGPCGGLYGPGALETGSPPRETRGENQGGKITSAGRRKSPGGLPKESYPGGETRGPRGGPRYKESKQYLGTPDRCAGPTNTSGGEGIDPPDEKKKWLVHTKHRAEAGERR